MTINYVIWGSDLHIDITLIRHKTKSMYIGSGLDFILPVDLNSFRSSANNKHQLQIASRK